MSVEHHSIRYRLHTPAKRYQMHLAYRMGHEAWVYYDDPYITVRVGTGTPSQAGSWLSAGRVYGHGTYQWRGRCSGGLPGGGMASGTFVILGGFENHHGSALEGLISAEWTGSRYQFRTTWAGGQELTWISGANWLPEREFRINWRASGVQFYVDNVLEATHTVSIPMATMQLFAEIITTANPSGTGAFSFFKRESFEQIR